MAITPDLSTIFGGYSQPQQNIPLPEDPDHIARLIRELQDSGNSAQGGSLAQLVQQGMTKGLTVDPGRGLQFEQQGGGAQGYNGALRPSDIPGNLVAPTTDPDTANALSQLMKTRNTPFKGGKTLGDVMDLLGATKGATPETQTGIVEQAFPGTRRPEKPTEVSLPKQAMAELTRRTQSNNIQAPDGQMLSIQGQAPGQGLLAGLTNEELKVLAGVESKPKEPTEPKTPTPALSKFLTDTYNSVYEATKGTPGQKKAAAMAASNAAARERGFGANMQEGFFSSSDKVVPVPQGSIPSGVTVKRIR